MNLTPEQRVHAAQLARQHLVLAAHHEAGHAIAAIHFGVPLVSVKIAKSGRGLTCRAYATESPFVELISCLCGPFAEQAAGGDGTYYGDRFGIAKALGELGANEVAKAHGYARHLVRSEWSVIARIARALTKCGRLSGPQVVSLYTTEKRRSYARAA